MVYLRKSKLALLHSYSKAKESLWLIRKASQIGFSAGLFVKLSNIIVTEKRALAYHHNKIVLHMFLDADAAFDKALHEIILGGMYQDGIQGDIWQYFSTMHQKSATHIKWSGAISESTFPETQGTRQGGVAGPLEYRQYVNPMVKQLEESFWKE